MPAIPAPTIQTSTWIFSSSEGAADLFVVADQIETLSREPVGCFVAGFWALRLCLRTLGVSSAKTFDRLNVHESRCNGGRFLVYQHKRGSSRASGCAKLNSHVLGSIRMAA